MGRRVHSRACCREPRPAELIFPALAGNSRRAGTAEGAQARRRDRRPETNAADGAREEVCLSARARAAARDISRVVSARAQIKDIDLDGNGTIDFEEFMQAVGRLPKSAKKNERGLVRQLIKSVSGMLLPPERRTAIANGLPRTIAAYAGLSERCESLVEHGLALWIWMKSPSTKTFRYHLGTTPMNSITRICAGRSRTTSEVLRAKRMATCRARFVSTARVWPAQPKS